MTIVVVFFSIKTFKKEKKKDHKLIKEEQSCWQSGNCTTELFQLPLAFRSSTVLVKHAMKRCILGEYRLMKSGGGMRRGEAIERKVGIRTRSLIKRGDGRCKSLSHGETDGGQRKEMHREREKLKSKKTG